MPDALNQSRLLVVHNDAAAKAYAHIQMAMKNLAPYRTIDEDMPDMFTSSMSPDTLLISHGGLGRDRIGSYADFIFLN